MVASRTDQLAQALWYTAPGRAEIREHALLALGEGAVRVRALYGGLSRGTEALVSSGRVPASEYERMRGPFMDGKFPFPVKYGYATVGQVEAGPSGLVGRTVFALHPHQTLFDVPASAVYVLPDSLPPDRAVLAANMETALNAVWDAAAGPADRIAVVGGGVVGALVAYLCGRLPGTDVTLVDINPARAELAATLGIGFAEPGAAKGDCDVVVHASGAATGLTTALELAGQEATVLEMSWYGDRQVAALLGGAFHSRRLKLISSQVGQVAPSHRPRWTHGRRLSAALALLSDVRLDALLTSEIDFHNLPERLPGIFDPNAGILCQVIDYR